MALEPQLLFSALTNHVYIVTKYVVLDKEERQFDALEKYDVTEQFKSLARQMLWAGLLEGDTE